MSETDSGAIYRSTDILKRPPTISPFCSFCQKNETSVLCEELFAHACRGHSSVGGDGESIVLAVKKDHEKRSKNEKLSV